MKIVTGLVCILLLCTAGCQNRGVFNSAQIKAMQQEGFTQQNDEWSLGLSDRILFGINESSLPDKVRQPSTVWPKGFRHWVFCT